MRAQLEAHLMDVNRTADYTYDREKMKDAIDLVVITDSEAILGIGGMSCLLPLGWQRWIGGYKPNGPACSWGFCRMTEAAARQTLTTQTRVWAVSPSPPPNPPCTRSAPV